MKKIAQPIVGYQVLKDLPPSGSSPSVPLSVPQSVSNSVSPDTATDIAPDITEMHEGLARPEVLLGSTYKLKAPVLSHAMYVTINDIILNQGTVHEERRPFEIFINSKNMEQFQWIVALTRVMSAVFRKGGDVVFLVEELKAVFDPNGGYYKKGGVFMPSLVAEIGSIIEQHLKAIGVITSHLSPEQLDLIAKKRAEIMGKTSLSSASSDGSILQNNQVSQTPVAPSLDRDSISPATSGSEATESGEFPANSTMCKKCFTKAVVILDGCQTCLSCGDSKCG